MRRIAMLVVPLLVAGSACGDNAPSKEDFAAKANPACATSNAELSGIVRPADIRQLGDVSGKLAESTEKQAAALKELEKPGGDREQLDQSLGSMDAVVASARKVQAAAAGGDMRTLETEVETLKAEAGKADDAARSYGLAECGKAARDASATIADATKPILKQEFIAKADALCADVNRKLDSIPEPETDAEVLKSIDESLALYDKLVADLKTLHVPASDQPAFAEILSANDKGAAIVRDARAALAARDETKAERLFEELDAASTEADRKADAFGFKDCGSAGSA